MTNSIRVSSTCSWKEPAVNTVALKSDLVHPSKVPSILEPVRRWRAASVIVAILLLVVAAASGPAAVAAASATTIQAGWLAADGGMAPATLIWPSR
jgi:hypothetical protein